MNNYNKWVSDMANIKFGKENIKSKKTQTNHGVLGETIIELNNGENYLGYFHYQRESVLFVKVGE